MSGNDATDCDIDTLLGDPSKRAAILQRLGQLGNPGVVSHLTLNGTTGGVEPPTSSGSVPTLVGRLQLLMALSPTQRRGIHSRLFRPCRNPPFPGLVCHNNLQVQPLNLPKLRQTTRNM